MEGNTVNLLLLLGQLVIAGVTTWVVTRRSGYQNLVDGAKAARDFQEINLTLQAEIKEQDNRIKALEDLLERAHLKVTLGIQIGKRPEIVSYEWITKVPPFVKDNE